jgi:hypothetical protein
MQGVCWRAYVLSHPEITGTAEAPDGSQERVSAEGNTYEEAREALTGKISEGRKLLVIGTNK